MTTETRVEAIRPIDKRLERSPPDIEFTGAKRWNGVLTAAMVGGRFLPFLSLQ